MLQQHKQKDAKSAEGLATSNLRRGASLSLSSLDERLFLGLEDDMSSLGDTFQHNQAFISDAQSASDAEEASDSQFLQKVADINAQMAAQLVGLARKESMGLGPSVSTGPSEATKSVSKISNKKPEQPNDISATAVSRTLASKNFKKIDSTQQSSQKLYQQAKTRHRRQTKRRTYRRLTLDLLTSDEEANEFVEERSSPYLEPLTRRNRQAKEPERRSSFETLYGDEFWSAVSVEKTSQCECSCHDNESGQALCEQQNSSSPIGCKQPDKKSTCSTEPAGAENSSEQNNAAAVAMNESSASSHPVERPRPAELVAKKMAGSQAANNSATSTSTGAASSYRTNPRRVVSMRRQDQEQHKLPERHSAGVRFSVPTAMEPCQKKDSLDHQHNGHQTSPPPLPPRMRRAAVRFRAGSFSQGLTDLQLQQQQLNQSSRLEIGVLLRGPPSSLSRQSSEELVVTNLRRVDSRDPVSQLEFMCRAMRLDDADLMEGAARRDRLGPMPPQQQQQHQPIRRWSTSSYKQYWRQTQRPDRIRDDQARRRLVCGPATAAEQQQQRQQQRQLPNFMGRASDGDRARLQGWWRVSRKRSSMRPPIGQPSEKATS
ncbi:hypothetical protein BOX15_Mlig020338g1 [Macrostomum lignano]|uniref:Uncharacterized protein n=2 Tax=Macrostomum lignano TaxID=282301 RepID=A0A267FA66_9PLAT|nr:hypothetical protein BOX15_Mlig020338g1 [Macrostomum lignano]